ncbi:hypothetical protein ACB092_10G202400 [Castanea dentata]
MLQSYVVYLGGHSHGQDPSLMDLHGVTNSHYGLLGFILGRSQSEWIVRKAVWYNFGYSYSAANKNMAVNWEEKTLYDY